MFAVIGCFTPTLVNEYMMVSVIKYKDKSLPFTLALTAAKLVVIVVSNLVLVVFTTTALSKPSVISNT